VPTLSPIKFKSPCISPDTRGCSCGKYEKYLFGRAVYTPGGHFGPYIRTSFILIVLTKGSLRLTVDDASYNLAPGEAILLHPGAKEFFRFSPDSESAHTWCEIWPDLLSSANRRLFRKTRGVHQAPASIHLLIEEGLTTPIQSNPNLHSAMSTLALACLLRFTAQANSLDQQSTAPPLHPILQRALDFATYHYVELRSGEDLARSIGISTSRLRALCKAAWSESPSAIIWRLKVEHAIQLIRSTGFTLGEIADNCGYANAFHLSRAVRRHTGHSPSRLRQIEWGK